MYGAPTPPVLGAQMPMGGQRTMTPASPAIVPAPSPSIMPDSGIPPGLEYLLPTKQITIQVVWDRGAGASAMGLGSLNKYNILDARGRRMYFAEDGDKRPYPHFRTGPWKIKVLDSFGQPVMQGGGEGSACCDGAGNGHDNIKVFKMDGGPLGAITSNPGEGCCKQSWSIKDAIGEPALRLENPRGRGFYPVMTPEKREVVGRIRVYDTPENMGGKYGVEFPQDLNVNLKAALLFAALMLDMDFYEKKRNEPKFDFHVHNNV